MNLTLRYTLRSPYHERLEDRDLLALTFELAIVEAINEAPGGELVEATVVRDGDTTAPLEISLISSDPSNIWAPETVMIPAGEDTLAFNLETVNNPLNAPDQIVTITASGEGHALASVSVTVSDDDTDELLTIGGKISNMLGSGEYVVLSNIVIPENQGLTIEPDTTLMFTNRTILAVSGDLIAEGDDGRLIQFTSNAVSPIPGDWGGISITEGGNAVLSHVDVGYGSNGLEIARDSTVAVNSANIHHNDIHGIHVTSAARFTSSDSVQISRSSIHDNRTGILISSRSIGCTSSRNATFVHGNDVYANDAGIVLSAGFSNGCVPSVSTSISSTVANNHIHQNRVGIDASARSWNGAKGSIAGNIWNNLIDDNTFHGITLDSGHIETAVVNNTIVNNGGSGIDHIGTAFPIRNNVIVNNAHGITSREPFDVSGAFVSHNLLFDNREGNFVNYPDSFGKLTTVNRNGTPADSAMNVVIRPEFLNGGFHLSPSSPAIDAGTDTGAPHRDIDGEQRASASVFGGGTANVGFYPLDIGYDEALRPRNVELGGDGEGYQQDFDAALGSRETFDVTHLPTGWYAHTGGNLTSIVVDEFPTNVVRPGPYNAGENFGPDRALALGNTADGNPAELFFEATISHQDASAMRLMFDIEAWAADPLSAKKSGEPGFVVSLELDNNGSFEETINFGLTTIPQVLTPDHERGDGTFSPAVQYSTGSRPKQVSLDDLDGDGDLDIVFQTTTIGVRLNNGHAIFSDAVLVDVPEPVRSFVVDDMNADGNLDLISAHGSSVSVMVGNGDGMFHLVGQYTVGDIPVRLVVIDLSGDGVLDVAVNNLLSDDVSVLLGHGDGTLETEVRYASGDRPGTLVAEDLDGDNRPDLVVLNNQTHDASVRLNNGDGTFADETRYALGTSPQGAVATEDWDNDGDLDLAVANLASGDVSLLFNNGSGEFPKHVTYPTIGDPDSVNGSDIDNDGDVDVITVSSRADTVSILTNNGNGEFRPAVAYPVGNQPGGIRLSDLDNDMDLDISVPNNVSGDVSILFNLGDGTFAQQIRYDVATRGRKFLRQLETGDLDGDDDVDIVAVDEIQSTVGVLRNIQTMVNGNDPSNRISFDSGVAEVTLPLGERVRIRFSVPENSQSENWVFGLDNVLFRTLSPGDTNGDGRFDSSDLVKVFQAGKYESGNPATFEEGDWNGDGVFDSGDLISAFQAGNYEIALPAIADSVFGNDFDKHRKIREPIRLESLDLLLADSDESAFVA